MVGIRQRGFPKVFEIGGVPHHRGSTAGAPKRWPGGADIPAAAPLRCTHRIMLQSHVQVKGPCHYHVCSPYPESSHSSHSIGPDSTVFSISHLVRGALGCASSCSQ